MAYCIVFASPPGSGKSPIASFLSYNLNLPIFSNDSIRSEVKEDTLMPDINDSLEIYKSRREERIKKLLSNGRSFIYDASVDRSFSEFFLKLEEAGYEPVVISIDLNDDFYREILKATQYGAALQMFDHYTADHRNFLASFHGTITVRITDENYKDRLKIALEGVATRIGIKI